MGIIDSTLAFFGLQSIGQPPVESPTTTDKLLTPASIPGGPTFTTIIYPGWQTSDNNFLVPPDPGLTKDEQVAEFKNTTYDAIDFIARFFAAVPYKIYDRSGDVVENHPFHQITENPFGKNSTYDINQIVLFYSMVCDLLIFGNVIWLADPGIKNIQKIYPQPPQLIDPEINKTTGIIDKYIFAKGHHKFEKTYDAEQILHIQFVDPKAGARFKWGKSPIAAHADVLAISNKLLVLIDNELDKLGIPAILAKIDGAKAGVTESTLESIKEKMINKLFTRKEKVAVYDAEFMDITLLQMKLNDFQFTENTETFTRKIASMFHLDPMFLGLTQTTNRAQAEAAIFMFTKFTIKPLLDQIESQLNSDLIHIAYGDGFTLRFDEVVPEDIEVLRANLDMAFRNGAATPNEIRTMLLGLDEIDIPAMNVTYLGFTLAPISIAGESLNPEDDTEIEIVDDDEEVLEIEEDEEEKVLMLSSAHEPEISISIKDVKQVSRETIARQRRKWQQLFNLSLQKADPNYTETLQKFFGKQMNGVDKRMREFSKGLIWVSTKQTDDEIQAALDFILFDIDDATDATMKVMGVPIGENLLFTGANHIAAMELPIAFDDVAPSLLDLLNTGGKAEGVFKFAQEINVTTDAALRKTLTEGIKAGETIQQLSERIAAVKTNAQGFRAVRIARTEIIGGYSRAADTTIKDTVAEFGGTPVKFWYTAGPAERPEHNANEQEAFAKNGLPLDQEFKANGLLYPGDPNGEAGQIINCLCVPGHVIEGLGA